MFAMPMPHVAMYVAMNVAMRVAMPMILDMHFGWHVALPIMLTCMVPCPCMLQFFDMPMLLVECRLPCMFAMHVSMLLPMPIPQAATYVAMNGEMPMPYVAVHDAMPIYIAPYVLPRRPWMLPCLLA